MPRAERAISIIRAMLPLSPVLGASSLMGAGVTTGVSSAGVSGSTSMGGTTISTSPGLEGLVSLSELGLSGLGSGSGSGLGSGSGSGLGSGSTGSVGSVVSTFLLAKVMTSSGAPTRTAMPVLSLTPPSME